jgi:hypothetical protein
MAQIFSPSTNTLSKVSIVAATLVVGAAGYAVTTINRWPWISNLNVAVEQDVPFSHKHHVAGLGIDCRFCHTAVEESANAGIPPVKTCMGCRSDVPVEWTRVHDLPDFVYFNHSIHLKKGVGCESCHGRVDTMPLMWKANSLNMEWCLACHRNPQDFVRPREQVTTMGWDPAQPAKSGSSLPPTTQAELGPRLVQEYKIQSLTHCSTCHR